MIFIALSLVFSKDFKNIKEEKSIFLTLCLLKRWIKIGIQMAKSPQRRAGLRKLNIYSTDSSLSWAKVFSL